MSSGVGVNDDVLNKYQELKLGHSLRYAIFKISDNAQEIHVDSTAPPSASYNDFVKVLPPNHARYAVYDYEYQFEGGQRNKILFVVWTPATATVKQKMLYAASKEALRKKLVGIGVEVQATDLSEIDNEAVLEKVLRV